MNITKNNSNFDRKEKELLVYFIASAIEEIEQKRLEKDFHDLLNVFSKESNAKSFYSTIRTINNLRKKNILDDAGTSSSIVFSSTAFIGGTIERELKKSLQMSFSG